MKTVDDILIVGKTKSINRSTNDTDYYLKLSDNTEISVSKEEFYSNIVGTTLRLESAVEYKWRLKRIYSNL